MAGKKRKQSPKVLSFVKQLEKEVNERVKAALGLECNRKEVREDIADSMGQFLKDHASEITEENKAEIERYAKQQLKDFHVFQSSVEQRFVDTKSKVGDISLEPEYLLECYQEEDSGSFQVTNEELESALTKILREIRKLSDNSSRRLDTLKSIAELLRDEKRRRKSYMESYVYEFICDELKLQQREPEP